MNKIHSQRIMDSLRFMFSKTGKSFKRTKTKKRKFVQINRDFVQIGGKPFKRNFVQKGRSFKKGKFVQKSLAKRSNGKNHYTYYYYYHLFFFIFFLLFYFILFFYRNILYHIYIYKIVLRILRRRAIVNYGSA